ncbi:MAG: thioesterase family protein [Gammaproteobacteria bacterium]
MKDTPLSAEVEMEVPFQDVDAMQVVWHGNYFRYFEAARSMLLRRIDYDYPEMRASEYMWPIIETRVRFVQAVRYRQHIIVGAGLAEWENRLKIDYLIRDADTGARLTTGYTIQCAVDARTLELQLVSPPVLLERLKNYL